MSIKKQLKLILILIPILLIFISCGSGKNKEMDSQRININDLTMNNIVHDELPDELVKRIKMFHSTLSEVNLTDLETTLTNFKRDMNPEAEVEVWETITSAYENSLKELNIESIGVKNEAYNLLLLRSMMPSKTVLQQIELKELTKEEAMRVLNQYGEEHTKIQIFNE